MSFSKPPHVGQVFTSIDREGPLFLLVVGSWRSQVLVIYDGSFTRRQSATGTIMTISVFDLVLE